MAIQVLPALAAGGKALLPYLTQAGIAAGVIGGTGRAINEIPGARERLGNTASDIAKGETYDPEKGLVGWDIGDDFRSLVTGVGKQQVEEAAATGFKDRMERRSKNENLGSRYTALGYDLPSEGPLVRYQDGQTEESFGTKLESAKTKLGKLEALKAAGGDLAGLNINSSIADIQQRLDTRILDREREESSKPGGAIYEANQLRDERRLERLERARDRDFADAQAQNRYAFEASEGRANRQQTLQLQLLQNQQKDLDREFQRDANRRDRQQQAIFGMIKGLTNMGAAFAL